MKVNVFLFLAFVCAVIAFLVQEMNNGKDWVFSVAGWLILTLVFYLASLLFGFSVGTNRQSNT